MRKESKQATKTSKKWIDFSDSSDQDQQTKNQHQQNTKINNHHHQHKKDTQYADKPVPKENLKDDRKQQMTLLKDIKGDQVWFELTCRNNYEYLLQKISDLWKQKQNNKNILFIYPTIDKQGSAYDVKVTIDFAEQWIMTGFDKKNLIHYEISKRNFNKNEKKSKNNNFDDHQKYRKFGEKPSYKPKFQEKTDNKPKKKYIQKQSQKKEEKKDNQIDIKKAEEQKASSFKKEQQIKKVQPTNEKKQPLKEKPKKKKQSKFYSKNPFEQFDESD